MVEIFTVIGMLVNIITLLLVYKRVRPAPSIPVAAGPDLDGALNELHTMSRNTGSKVHIHDIEQVLRRAIG